MGDLSANFSRSEFKCKCGCGADQIDPMLINALEAVRKAIGNNPISVLSGVRCESHNKYVGGAKNSQHLKGTAADIKCAIPAKILADIINVNLNVGGLGVYPGFVHIDVRSIKARW